MVENFGRFGIFWLKISGGSGFFGSADTAKVLKTSSVLPVSQTGDTELVFNTFAESAESKNPEPPEMFSHISGDRQPLDEPSHGREKWLKIDFSQISGDLVEHIGNRQTNPATGDKSG